MKRTLPILGLAVALVGILQPITNIPQSPKVSADTAKQTTIQITQPKTEAPVAVVSTEPPVEAPVAAPEPEPVVETYVAPEPVYTAPVMPPSDAKAFIYSNESGNRPWAKNPGGCYGLGQDCNGIVENLCGADYACQDEYFTNYMLRRYGSWEAAKAFWLARVPINGQDVGNWW